MIPKIRKKSIKDFEKVFKEQIKNNLNSPFCFDKENAVQQALYYMQGYFQKDNSLISKVLLIINNETYKNNIKHKK